MQQKSSELKGIVQQFGGGGEGLDWANSIRTDKTGEAAIFKPHFKGTPSLDEQKTIFCRLMISSMILTG